MPQSKRLTYSEVKQANPDTSREQHCEVRQIIKIRFVIRFSKFHLSVLGEIEDNDKKEPNILGADVHPREDLCDPQHPFRHLSASDIGLNCAPDHKEPDDSGGQKSHHWVETQENSKLYPSNLSPFPVDTKPTKLFRRVLVYLHCSTGEGNAMLKLYTEYVNYAL